MQRVPPWHQVNPHFYHCCRPWEELAGHFRKWKDQNTPDPKPLFQWAAEPMACEDTCLLAWGNVLKLQQLSPAQQFCKMTPVGSLSFNTGGIKGSNQGGPCWWPLFSVKAKSLNNVTKVQNLADHHQLLFLFLRNTWVFLLRTQQNKSLTLRVLFLFPESSLNHLTILLFVLYIESQ